MSYSKIDLENRIFARADRLGEAVWGWEGELVYAGKDLCLQLLMCVYNGFFAAENRAFLADTDECLNGFWGARGGPRRRRGGGRAGPCTASRGRCGIVKIPFGMGQSKSVLNSGPRAGKSAG